MIYLVNDLKAINERKIKELQDKKDLNNEYEIQLCIQKILNEEFCFLKMTIETAFSILGKLIEESDIEETYKNLISAKNFKNHKI